MREETAATVKRKMQIPEWYMQELETQNYNTTFQQKCTTQLYNTTLQHKFATKDTSAVHA
jgi:hypothetical protein